MVKKIFLYTTCFILVLVAGCSTSQKAAKPYDKSFIEIETFLQSLIDTAGIPGIAIAITDEYISCL